MLYTCGYGDGGHAMVVVVGVVALLVSNGPWLCTKHYLVGNEGFSQAYYKLKLGDCIIRFNSFPYLFLQSRLNL